jgi:hypothetical protein
VEAALVLEPATVLIADALTADTKDSVGIMEKPESSDSLAEEPAEASTT